MKPDRKKISDASKIYRSERANICEACGQKGGFMGVSHIISVHKCLYDDRFPKELAWSEENFALECHDTMVGGFSCHLRTETMKAEHLIGQLNLDKKLRLYDKYMPYLAEEIRELLNK